MKVRALDQQLAPLRRVLGYALSHGRVPAYFESNGGRWVDAALHLDLPQAIRDQLAQVKGQLEGFDEADDQTERLRAMSQMVTRVDAVLGLPLSEPVRLKRRRRPAPKPDPTPAPTSTRSAPKKKGRGGSPRARPEPVAAAGPFWRGRFDLPLNELDLAPGVVAAFAEEGITTVGEVLRLVPRGHEVLKPVQGAGRALTEPRAAVSGRVKSRVTQLQPDGGRVTRVVLHGAGQLTVEWDAPPPPWVWARLATGAKVILAGDVEGEGDDAILRNAELVTEEERRGARLARYGLNAVDDAVVRGVVFRLLEGDAIGRVRDPIHKAILARHGLSALGPALVGLHHRGRHQERKRLAFDEAFALQLGLLLPRHRSTRERGIAHTVRHGLSSQLGREAEMVLSDAEQSGLDDIKRDLRRQTPMLRLLTGPVGAGRRRVVLAAAAMVAESKAQVLVLGADAVTTELWFALAEPLLREIGLVARHVEAAPGAAMRDALRRGEVHVLFAPTNAIDEEVEFRRLGLVVGEERQELGITSAFAARLRAPLPDVLVTTPWPPPLRVLWTTYADHDLTVLADPGRTPPEARLWRAEKRVEAYAQAAEAVAEGAQAVVLFPVGQGTGADVLEPREAIRVLQALESQVFAGRKLALFHGGLPRDERYRTLDDFLHRRVDVLVSTCRLEDAPRIPGLRIAVVEQADRIDAGRLARIQALIAGDPAGTLHLVAGEVPDTEGLGRLEGLVEGRLDGAIPDEPGTDGVPLPQLSAVDLDRDQDVVLAARDEASRVLYADPSLRASNHSELVRLVRERWVEAWSGPDAPQLPIREGGGSPRRRRRRRKK